MNIENLLNSTEAIILGTLVLTLVVSNFFKGRVLLFSLITLPATFMHELMHFLVSLITFGRPVSFTIIPRRSEDGKGWVLGSVSSRGMFWLNQGIISLAPLFLWVGFYFTWVNLDLILKYVDNIYLVGYLAANLIIGGLPSSSDLKLAIRSPFGLIVIFALAYYLMERL